MSFLVYFIFIYIFLELQLGKKMKKNEKMKYSEKGFTESNLSKSFVVLMEGFIPLFIF